MNVLFINHKQQNCGVYQYGKRVFDIIKNDKSINYTYAEVDSVECLNKILSEIMVDIIIYNYYPNATMPWLNNNTIPKNVKNIVLKHEARYEEYMFDAICDTNPTQEESNKYFSIPRPIFENIDETTLSSHVLSERNTEFINAYLHTNLPIFGSFGFGFENKGFDKIVKMINEQYDEAIIKFIIPIAHFDPNPNTISIMHQKCLAENKKPGIKLIITHDFFPTEALLHFLKSNTMNIFLYDYMHGRGISSVIDYALSVRKPIGISDSFMFRHIYSDNICLYKIPIKECLNTSLEYISIFLDKYSNTNMINKFRQVILKGSEK
jgi:hypothetical protein